MKASVIGATGYAGAELLRLLTGHPQVEIAYITSESSAGEKADSAVSRPAFSACLYNGSAAAGTYGASAAAPYCAQSRRSALALA